jgi:sporulation protein YlmC with PRC-barrel domain
MDIPIKAQVECLDGVCGRSTAVVINPTTRFVTHVVVEEKDDPHAQYLVPLEEIKLGMPHLIRLRCTKHELQKMPRFVRIDYERRSAPYTLYPSGDYLIGPTVIMEDSLVPIPHPQVPEGELVVRPGAQVKASDGYIGQVDEFLIDPTTEQIDYLVLRERHLWHRAELSVPAAQIERIADNTVYLKSDRRTIEHMQLQ